MAVWRGVVGLVAGLCLCLSACSDSSGGPNAEQPTTDERGVAVRIVGVLGADGRLCPHSWRDCPSGIAVDGDTAGLDESSGVVSAIGWYDGARVLLAAPLAEVVSVTIRSSGQKDPMAIFHLGLDDGVQPVSSGGENPDTGREEVDVEAVDSRGLDAIAALRGVDASVFVELLDRPLTDLPAWQNPVQGNVEIVTAGSRLTGSLDGLFNDVTLEYDAATGCLSASDGTAILWPFGWTAVSDDAGVSVFDARGEEFARTGVPFTMGGGFFDGSPEGPHATGVDRCGADHSFAAAADLSP